MSERHTDIATLDNTQVWGCNRCLFTAAQEEAIPAHLKSLTGFAHSPKLPEVIQITTKGAGHERVLHSGFIGLIHQRSMANGSACRIQQEGYDPAEHPSRDPIALAS